MSLWTPAQKCPDVHDSTTDPLSIAWNSLTCLVNVENQSKRALLLTVERGLSVTAYCGERLANYLTRDLAE